jgi:hypothetical protein
LPLRQSSCRGTGQMPGLFSLNAPLESRKLHLAVRASSRGVDRHGTDDSCSREYLQVIHSPFHLQADGGEQLVAHEQHPHRHKHRLILSRNRGHTDPAPGLRVRTFAPLALLKFRATICSLLLPSCHFAVCARNSLLFFEIPSNAWSDVHGARTYSPKNYRIVSPS